MNINTINNQNFGKIVIPYRAKDAAENDIIKGIGTGEWKTFKEKFRVCNNAYDKDYDIFVTPTGAKVVNKQTESVKSFSIGHDIDKNTPNPLYHLLNLAMNYVEFKENKMLTNR